MPIEELLFVIVVIESSILFALGMVYIHNKVK